MKKKQWMRIVVTIVICAATTIVKAQTSKPLRMGFGLNVGYTLNDPIRVTLGGDLRLQQSFGNDVSGILTTGYYHFFKATKYGEGFGIVPLKAGLKYFPAKHIYIAGEAGAGFGIKSSTGTSFVYSPSVGLAFGDGFDVSLKYENYTKYKGNLQQLVLRFAYGFKL